MDSRIKELRTRGDKLFGSRMRLLSLWQTIAENFYPQRAEFTRTLPLGYEFASDLTTSYPLIAQRELSSQVSAMLRPRELVWAKVSVDNIDTVDRAGKEWLEWATTVLRSAMYEKKSNFVKATKEGDRDFTAFGQCVLSVEWDWKTMALLYRSWHLRDVVWAEQYNSMIGEIHRNWKPTARTLCQMFPATVSPKVQKACEKEPFKEFNVRRVMMPADDYEAPVGKKWKTPWVSIYVDVDNDTIMEEVGSLTSKHVIPRWETPGSGNQYAYSPCTIAALPDARLIQAMTLTLLEAGEMAVRPPMLAVGDAIRSDINLFAGGITRVDADYDERLGEVLRPISQDKNGLPFGREISGDIKGALMEAFYLNKLNLPPVTHEMTAFETSQRIQEYIRAALPLFEPLEDEYNGGLCEETFLQLQAVGMFKRRPLPASLVNRDVRWKFISPLHDAIERKDAGAFVESQQLIRSALELDPTSAYVVDVNAALRDALVGVGAPMRWQRDQDVVDQMSQQAQQSAQEQAALQQVQQGALAAKSLGEGGKALQEAGVAA